MLEEMVVRAALREQREALAVAERFGQLVPATERTGRKRLGILAHRRSSAVVPGRVSERARRRIVGTTAPVRSA